MSLIFGIVIAVVLGVLISLGVAPASSDSGSNSTDWGYATPTVIHIIPPPAYPAPYATPTP